MQNYQPKIKTNGLLIGFNNWKHIAICSMPNSAKENFRIMSLIIISLIIVFIGIIMMLSGNDMNPYTSLDLGPGLQLKISNTQQLLVGGMCFASVIVLFGKRNQHH